jgi:hypothetical protein
MSLGSKLLIIYLWIMSVSGVAFISHEFGMMEGATLTKRDLASHNEKLWNCQAILTGDLE